MPTKRLIEALFPQGRSAVLSVLTHVGGEGLHLREIARRANLNSKMMVDKSYSD